MEKRYDKDGKEVEMPSTDVYVSARLGNESAFEKTMEYKKASTPEQMAERIKELEKENQKLKSESDMVPESWHKEEMNGRIRMRRLYADKIFELKESQQENQRLREGIKELCKNIPSMHCTQDSVKNILEQLLQTKQNQDNICLSCEKEPATLGMGKLKTVCSKCWNSIFEQNQEG